MKHAIQIIRERKISDARNNAINLRALNRTRSRSIYASARLLYTPVNITDQRAITAYLTAYGYTFSTTIGGDILITVPRDSIIVSNIKSAIHVITGIKRDNLNFSFVSAHGA